MCILSILSIYIYIYIYIYIIHIYITHISCSMGARALSQKSMDSSKLSLDGCLFIPDMLLCLCYLYAYSFLLYYDKYVCYAFVMSVLLSCFRRPWDGCAAGIAAHSAEPLGQAHDAAPHVRRLVQACLVRVQNDVVIQFYNFIDVYMCIYIYDMICYHDMILYNIMECSMI